MHLYSYALILKSAGKLQEKEEVWAGVGYTVRHDGDDC